VVNTPDEVFVHTVENLIDFTITEIQDPLDLISETPADDISEPDDFSKEEEFNIEYEDMEGNNDHEEEGVLHIIFVIPMIVNDVNLSIAFRGVTVA
jgi:hypothetical protein